MIRDLGREEAKSVSESRRKKDEQMSTPHSTAAHTPILGAIFWRIW
jgi:hypothetical protein